MKQKAPKKRGLHGLRLEGLMSELQTKIIKLILEDENAMRIALEFILKDQEVSQEPEGDLLAS